MFAFLRRLGGPVRYETPRAEPSRHDLAELFPPVPEDLPRKLAALDESVERRIRNFDRAIEQAIQDGDMRAVDIMLDARNRIRPARPAPVPVIPGRSS